MYVLRVVELAVVQIVQIVQYVVAVLVLVVAVCFPYAVALVVHAHFFLVVADAPLVVVIVLGYLARYVLDLPPHYDFRCLYLVELNLLHLHL